MSIKKVILYRKNSLFYRTQNGADRGELWMCLIHTCELGGSNPFEYLAELLDHAEDVATHPEHWMPWNYQQALDHSPPDPCFSSLPAH